MLKRDKKRCRIVCKSQNVCPEEEGSSWMADHSRARHMGLVSADPRDDYDFVVFGSKNPPVDARRFPPNRSGTQGQEDKALPAPPNQEYGEF